MNQHRDSEQPENSKRMPRGEQLTLGLLIDIAFGFIVLVASAVAPNLTVWSILAVASIAVLWVWVRVIYRIRAAESQAKKGARGGSSAV
jgi:uncharacterized membrane protein HdeD (DUF308 family)